MKQVSLPHHNPKDAHAQKLEMRLTLLGSLHSDQRLSRTVETILVVFEVNYETTLIVGDVLNGSFWQDEGEHAP